MSPENARMYVFLRGNKWSECKLYFVNVYMCSLHVYRHNLKYTVLVIGPYEGSGCIHYLCEYLSYCSTISCVSYICVLVITHSEYGIGLLLYETEAQPRSSVNNEDAIRVNGL